MKQIKHKNFASKKAMSTFEIIGYAILALVVILVCIVIFTKLTKAPGSSISDISDSTTGNVKSCKEDPANCNPLGNLKSPVLEYFQTVLDSNNHGEL